MTGNEFADIAINIVVGALAFALAIAVLYKMYCQVELWWNIMTADEQERFGLTVLLTVFACGFIALSYFVGGVITAILSGE